MSCQWLNLFHHKFLADQTQAEPAFLLGKLAIYGIALILVDGKTSPPFSDKFWSDLGAAKARSSPSDVVALAEGSVGTNSINLNSTDDF